MPIETPISDLIAQLSQAGLRPGDRLVKQILAAGTAARDPLLALATDLEAMHEDEPECYGPLHGLRLLGELGDPAIVGPLLAALPVPVYPPDEESGYVDIPATLWAEEVLQMIARCGDTVEGLLWAWAADESHSDVSRGSALQGLAYVATLRDEPETIVAEARRWLTSGSSPIIMAGLINLLADLGDKASYQAIMAAYRNGQVDQERMPAAIARQLLLGGGRRDLSCVRHPLWERYDEHGPAPDRY